MGDIVLGIVGAIVGGFLSGLILGRMVTGFNLESVLVAFLGAVVLIAVSRCSLGDAHALSNWRKNS